MLTASEDKEIFTPIKDNEAWSISNFGRVYNSKKNAFHILKTNNDDGTLYTYINSKRVSIKSLVAKHFVITNSIDRSIYQGKACIGYKDGDITNNNAANLTFCSAGDSRFVIAHHVLRKYIDPDSTPETRDEQEVPKRGRGRNAKFTSIPQYENISERRQQQPSYEPCTEPVLIVTESTD